MCLWALVNISEGHAWNVVSTGQSKPSGGAGCGGSREIGTTEENHDEARNRDTQWTRECGWMRMTWAGVSGVCWFRTVPSHDILGHEHGNTRMDHQQRNNHTHGHISQTTHTRPHVRAQNQQPQTESKSSSHPTFHVHSCP